MKGFSRRLRLLLLLVIAGLVAANAWLWLRPDKHEAQQFSISPTTLGEKISDSTNYPEFDQGRHGWTVRGQIVPSLAPFVRDAGKGPDGGGRYLVFRLSGDATIDGFRQALLAISQAGVCQAGVVDSAANAGSAMKEVRIFRIDWVLDQGQRQHCIPKPGSA